MDHDCLAAFLGGEIERNHREAMLAQGIEFPGVEPEGGTFEFGEKKEREDDSDVTDDHASCSNCCDFDVTVEHPCDTEAPQCDTKAECHTHPPHCKTNEEHCDHKKGYEPPKHASWLDKP